jgi:hypothetical protein
MPATTGNPETDSVTTGVVVISAAIYERRL